MRYWTYAEIKDKVQKDLGIEQEEFVVDSELLGYCNAAIDEAEAEVHTIYEDYFLTNATIDFVQGTALYALPTDIYANKVRGIVFENQNEVYNLKRIRFNNKFIDIATTLKYADADYYRYFTINRSAADGVQIQVVPTPRTDITGALTVWYLRNSNRIYTDTDVCDIPEFVQFVLQYMKVRIYEKEGHPNLVVANSMLEQQRRQMVNTLTSMIPDGDNTVEQDLTHYEDMGIAPFESNW